MTIEPLHYYNKGFNDCLRQMVDKGTEMKSNEKQIAGNHYKSNIQHWDYVVANDLDYFQAQITKYVTRWKKKNGMTDLLKAQHFLEKYIEVMKSEQAGEDATPSYVNQ
jgi:hypothetical protein